MKTLFLQASTLAIILVSADSIFYSNQPEEYEVLASGTSKKKLLETAENYWDDNDIIEEYRIYLEVL